MNVTAIRLYSSSLFWNNGSQEYVEFSFINSDPGAAYRIKNASGLEPPELIGSMTNTSPASNFGALVPREIGILLDLNANNSSGKTIPQLRDDLYRLISVPRGLGNQMVLVFMDGTTPVAKINGLITKLDTNPFSQETEAIFVMTCDDPMIKGPEQVDVASVWVPHPTVSGLYEFDDTESTAPHGVYLGALVTGSMGAFWLDMTHPNGSFKTILIDYNFVNNDILLLYSVFNEVLVQVTRGASTIGLGNYILMGSSLPAVYPGINTFHFHYSNLFTITNLFHYPTYWGI